MVMVLLKFLCYPAELSLFIIITIVVIIIINKLLEPPWPTKWHALDRKADQDETKGAEKKETLFPSSLAK